MKNPKSSKILLDARLYGLENAGLGRYVINLVRSLSEGDKENEYVILLRKKYFETLSLPANWKKVLADFSHYSFSEQFKLPFLISRENSDIVHFPHFNIPIFFNGNFVVTIHDMLMHKQKGLDATTLPTFWYYIKRLAYRIVFDMAVKRAKAIIVPSFSVRSEVINFYKIKESKVVVTYEGIDEKIKNTEKIEVKKPYFLYIGNAYPHKNLKKLIEALVFLNKERKEKVLLAISSSRNIFTERLKQTVKLLKAEELVKFLGFVGDNQIGDLYKNSEAFVFPSLSEGFGLPGLEAMANKTLVLASDIPVFREVYDKAALYFDPRSNDSIAKEMEEVLQMPAKEKNDRIEFALSYIKKYSWSKMARETLQVYKDLT